ncbi:Ig-like domain-containing protein [Anaeromicropila herbilytica]|nr:Ig-like domain-containing protein [Anaeromicropila herbilytica]
MILVVVLTICPVGVGGKEVKAATGTVITSANGLNTYSISHSNIKEIDITNLGSNAQINIGASGYSINYGTDISFTPDSTSAYVIKGNNSTVKLSISQVSNITVYFVDAAIGSISTYNANTNFVICGTLNMQQGFNPNSPSNGYYSFNLTGFGTKDDSKIISGSGALINTSTNNVSVSNLDIRLVGSSETSLRAYNKAVVTNCNIYADNTILNSNQIYGSYSNCNISGVTLMSGASVSNSIIKDGTINGTFSASNSVITNVMMYRLRDYDDNLVLTDTYISGKIYTNSHSFGGKKTIQAIRSTMLFGESDGSQYYWNTATIDHSSIYSVSNSGIKPAVTNVNVDGNNVFVKRFRISGHNNEDVLVDFKDGDDPIPLKTDASGYLYLYLPSGATSISVEIVSSKDIYDTTFPAVTADSSSTIALAQNGNADTTQLQSQIEQLKKEISDLQNQLNSVNSKLTDAQQEITNLTKDNQDLSNSLADTQKKMNELVQEKSNLQKELDAANQTITDLQQQLSNKDSDIANLTEKVKGLQDTITNLTNQNNALQSQVDSYVSLLNDIKNSLGVGSYDDILDAINQLKQQISNLQQTNKELNNQLVDANTHINDWKNKFDQLKADKDVSDSELQVALEKISNLQNQRDELQSQVDSLNTVITELNKKIQDLEAQVTSKDISILDLQKQIVDAVALIQDKDSKIHDLESQISNLSNDINELKDLLSEIRDELGVSDNKDVIKAIQDLKDSVTNKVNENTELQNHISKIESLLVEEKKKSDSLSNLLDQLKGLVNANTDEDIANKVKDLQQQLLDANQKIAQLTQDKNDLVSTMSTMQTKINELTNQVAELEELLKTNGTDVQKRIEELQNKVIELENQNVDLKDSIQQLETKVTDMTKINQELQKQIDYLQALLDTANMTIEQLRNELANQIAANKTLTDENTTLKNEVESLKKKVKELEQKETTSAPSEPISNPGDVTIKENDSIAKEVTEKVINDVVVQEGWEFSDNPTSGWNSTLDVSESNAEGIYTFFNHDSSASLLSTKAHILSSKKEHVFYARKVGNDKVVYICSYVIKDNEIVTSFKSTNKVITLNYEEDNTYDITVPSSVVFSVSANYGNNKEKGIYYQVVNKDSDFDPDGSWLPVENNKINLAKVKEACRVYIKYVDNNGNFVVDKTAGFKPKEKTETPTFAMHKVLIKGYRFNLNMNNISKVNNSMITYNSSNKKVASVDNNGSIVAKSKGRADITVEVKAKNYTYKAVINVTVRDDIQTKFYNLKNEKAFTTVTTNDPVLVIYKLLKEGKQTKLKLSGYDSVSYVSSDPTIAAVSKNGTIIGKKKGFTTITVIAVKDNVKYAYQIVVRVKDATKNENINEYLYY